MNILFLSISEAISNINNRGIYPDLLRKFAKEGHHIYIVCPLERRQKKQTYLTRHKNVSTLRVKTLNITQINVFEKGLGLLLIHHQYARAIELFFKGVAFDLVLYSTPPITLNTLVARLKDQHKAKTYLLLKDIFPQNAVDLGLLKRGNPLLWYFRNKEKQLYSVSDIIGCMSPANINYLLANNKGIVDEKKIEVCPNSIEVSSDNSEVDKDQIRAKHKLPQDKTILIYGGNLGKPQGIDFLVEVLKYNEHRTDIFFVIAGTGTDAYKLKRYIDKNKPKHVIMLQKMPRLQFDQLVSACDIGLIFLDKRYTIPNFPSRLLNYLEFKMPLLMATDKHTDIGTIAESNGFGFWVESANASEFSKAMNQLAHDKALRVSMGQKGFDYLINNYSVDVSYNTIMAHFKQHQSDQY